MAIIKQVIKNICGYGFKKTKEFRDMENSQNEIKVLKKTCIQLRHKLHYMESGKITVFFVCQRVSFWGSLKSIYESMLNDPLFNVQIISVPNKKQLKSVGLNNDEYEDEGVMAYFSRLGINTIEGYNKSSKKWIDLTKTQADYIFFQTPYDITRFQEYNSKLISKYIEICYVPYAILMFKGIVEECTFQKDYFDNVSLYFAESNYHLQEANKNFNLQKNTDINVFLSGYPRFDNLDQYEKTEALKGVWNFERNPSIKRVIWTPRWSTNESTCTFFDYKDKLVEYVKTNKNVDFIFRPHPQAFSEWNATGELPEIEAEEYKQSYNVLRNAAIDFSNDFLQTFYSSDILITDISSIIPEYFLTKKPIIYCNKTDVFNEFGEQLAKGFYWVNTWDELKEVLNRLLLGQDPLKEKRNELIQSYFKISTNSGQIIKDIIKKKYLEDVNA